MRGCCQSQVPLGGWGPEFTPGRTVCAPACWTRCVEADRAPKAAAMSERGPGGPCWPTGHVFLLYHWTGCPRETHPTSPGAWVPLIPQARLKFRKCLKRTSSDGVCDYPSERVLYTYPTSLALWVYIGRLKTLFLIVGYIFVYSLTYFE